METEPVDYKQYHDDFPRALQLAKYHLKEWGKIEKDITALSDEEKEFAIRLYATLKHMTEEERQLLGDKYRVDVFGRYANPDLELAKQYEMELDYYRRLRKGIEYKFFYYLREHIADLLEDLGYYD